MFPCFPNFRLSDCTLGYTKGFRYLSLSSRILSDDYHGSITQFCPWFSFSKTLSLFLATIIYIVLIGSKKDMLRIYTTWIVARMKYVKTIWDRSFIDLPGNTMCEDRFFITDLSIPLSIYRSRPKPASSVGLRQPIFLESNLKRGPSVDTQRKGLSDDCSKSPIKQGRKTFFGFGRKILAKDFFFGLSP